MRAREISREAWRNARCAPVRSVGMVLAVALMCSSAVGAELVATSRILDAHSGFVRAGGYVAVVVSTGSDGLSAFSCRRLGSLDSVVSAGTLLDTNRSMLRSAPGREFRTLGVDGNTLAILAPALSARSSDPRGEVAVGGAMAVEMGLSPGAFITVDQTVGEAATRRISVVFDSSLRAPRYSSVAATMVPASAAATECWVEFHPQTYEAGVGALGAALMTGEEHAVARRVLDPGYDVKRARHDLDSRLGRLAWVIGGLVVGALLWLSAWSRRADFALLRAMGWRAASTASVIQLENTYLVMAGATIGWAWATLTVEAVHGPLTADQLFVANRTAASMVFLALAVGALTTTTTGRGRSTMALLKHE